MKTDAHKSSETVSLTLFSVYGRQCPRLNARAAATVHPEELDQLDEPLAVRCHQCGKKLCDKYALKKHVSQGRPVVVILRYCNAFIEFVKSLFESTGIEYLNRLLHTVKHESNTVIKLKFSGCDVMFNIGRGGGGITFSPRPCCWVYKKMKSDQRQVLFSLYAFYCSAMLCLFP